MARFARDTHLGPRRRVRVRRGVELLRQVRRVAVHARDVPDLAEIVVRIVRDRRDLFPVDPSLRLVVPERWQDVDAAVGQFREIALEPAGAERVVDLELLRGPAVVNNRYEVAAVVRLHGVRAAVLRKLHWRIGAEIADHGGFGDRLRHLTMKRAAP